MGAAERIRTEAAALLPRGDGERLLALFVVASLPAALVAAWQAGLARAPAATDDPGAAVQATLAGLRLLGVQAGIALVTAAAWERLFATIRGRRPDTGWLAPAWLYVLLLPPGLPAAYVVAGMSFGAVFGMHVFGGSGRYVASPAILGALFLEFAYPALGSGAPSFASVVAWPADPPVAAFLFLSACGAGALALVAAGAASWRTLAGAALGLALATLPAMAAGDVMAPAGHAASGAFALCWAFVLTDPSTEALTRAGRWAHGLVFAALVVLMREADPATPDGVLTAALLAGLLVPLADALAVELRIRRRGPTLELDS